jgi:hypothetical protein
MTFSFEARSILVMEHEPGMQSSRLVETQFNLDVSDNLDKSAYLTEDDIPTKEGHRMLTNVLVQGLISNIHVAHKKGYRNDSEHIRYIKDELQRGFVENVTVEKGYFNEKDH